MKKIFIYDRFGKLIYQLSPYQSWNGTLNGKKSTGKRLLVYR
ncbi:hypothetical protein ACFSO9_06545 [Mesonia maritima]